MSSRKLGLLDKLVASVLVCSGLMGVFLFFAVGDVDSMSVGDFLVPVCKNDKKTKGSALNGQWVMVQNDLT